MRVLLDAHISGRRVGHALRAGGHDVLALDEDDQLSRLVDEQVLALAAEERRIVVTYDIRDFARLGRRWAEAGRTHGGLILVTHSHARYGLILRGLELQFAAHPAQDDWTDRMAFLAREP